MACQKAKNRPMIQDPFENFALDPDPELGQGLVFAHTARAGVGLFGGGYSEFINIYH